MNEVNINKSKLTANHFYEKKWIQFVAFALLFLGFVNIFSAWFSFDVPRLKIINEIFEYQIIKGSRYLVIITGIISILIAPALYRQKRIAWWISVILLAVSGFAHIVKGADIEEASLCILLLGVLLPLYKYCYVKSDPLRVVRSGWIILASIVFVISYTFIGVHFFVDRFGVDINTLPAWKIALDALVFDTSAIRPEGHAAKFFADSLLIINTFSILTGVFLSLSPVVARRLPQINEDKFKKIVDQNALQPVQHFTITRDYQHFYLSDNQKEGSKEALISYKVSNRVAMAIGNPCGDMPLIDIMEKWIGDTVEHDWIPAVYQAQGEFLELLKKAGFSSIPIGVEAVVNLNEFSLEGKTKQDLRTAKNRATKEGWIIREYEEKDWEKIRKLDSKWLKIHGKAENTFAMGKSSPKYLLETRSVVVLDNDNNLLGYLNSVELPGINSRAVDLMRRDPESPKGVMEALFINEILQAKSEGRQFYDLGFSPLAKIDESFSDNKTVTKLLKLIYERQKKYYDFQGLHLFKSKFSPQWNPSYLVYSSQLDLPSVLLALLDFNKGK